MFEKILPLIVTLVVLIIFSPIYFLRRKTMLMADNDLKKIDAEDWKRQKKFGSYTRLITRVVWGGGLITVAVVNPSDANSASWPILYGLIGVILIIWGLLGFRVEAVEMRSLN